MGQENKEVDFVEKVFKKIEHPTILTRKYVHNQTTLLVGKAIQMRTSSALLIAIKFLITTLMMPNEFNFSIQQTSNRPPQTKEKDLYGVPSDQSEGNNDMVWGENGLAYLWIGPQLSILLASPSTSKTNKQVPAFSTLQQKILSLYGQKHEGYVEKGNKQKTKETLKEKESKLFNAPNQLELGEGLMEETASRGQKRSKEVNHANRKSSKEDITENIN